MNSDVLSKSYTDSLHSYLAAQYPDDDPLVDSNRRPSYASIHSNLSTAAYSIPRSSYYQSTMGDNKHQSMSDLYIPPDGLSRTPTATTNHTNLDPTPLPKLQMLILSIILFSEPLTSTILLPFIYFMVQLIDFVTIDASHPHFIHAHMLCVIFSLFLPHWTQKKQLKDFHLSDDEKEIGTYAGWISKLLEGERERGKGVVMGLAAAGAYASPYHRVSWLDVARKTSRCAGSRLG